MKAPDIKEFERLNTFEWNTNKIYNKLIKDRNSISFVNNCYLINNKKNRKIYTSLNKNKQNININNNIIFAKDEEAQNSKPKFG